MKSENLSSGERWQRFSTETLEAIRERLETTKVNDDLPLESALVLTEVLNQLSSRKVGSA